MACARGGAPRPRVGVPRCVSARRRLLLAKIYIDAVVVVAVVVVVVVVFSVAVLPALNKWTIPQFCAAPTRHDFAKEVLPFLSSRLDTVLCKHGSQVIVHVGRK
jgi:hypothetical protein